MILPAASAAIRDTHGSGASVTGASPQTGSAPGGISPGSSAQNTAPQNVNSKDSPAGSGNLPAAQSLHAATDPSGASAPAAASTGAASVPAAPIAGGSTLPIPPQPPPAPTPDAQAKPGTPSGGAAGSAATALAAAENPAVAVPGPVQVAQMASRAGQAEMRIGMNTTAFGSVEVRTVVHASDVGLTIGSEKGDLRGFLSNEMPAISNSLQQQNLRLNSVSFLPGFANSNDAPGGGGSGQQRAFVPMSAAANSASPEAAEDSIEPAPAGLFGGGGGGLSILA
jgi:hypothetical protein